MYDIKNKYLDIVSDYNQNVNIKEIYEELNVAIINDGLKGFANSNDFEDACYKTIKICLQYEDYINSNNILQVYKLNKRTINKPEWFYVFSAKIYGRRTTNYYFDKPNKLTEKLDKVSVASIDAILCDLLNFYFNNLYLKNKKVYEEKIKSFINQFSDAKYTQFSKSSVKFNDYLEGKILEDDFTFDYELEAKPEAKNIEPKQIIEPVKVESDSFNYYEGITDPSILILGKSEINPDQIYAICKGHGFDKKHVYMELEYEKIPKVDISKYQYNLNNRNCIGFILGPMPHSHTNKGDYSSLSAYLQATEGYPMVYECRANNQSSELKLTKKNLNQALDAIVANYNAINT